MNSTVIHRHGQILLKGDFEFASQFCHKLQCRLAFSHLILLCLQLPIDKMEILCNSPTFVQICVNVEWFGKMSFRFAQRLNNWAWISTGIANTPRSTNKRIHHFNENASLLSVSSVLTRIRVLKFLLSFYSCCKSFAYVSNPCVCIGISSNKAAERRPVRTAGTQTYQNRRWREHSHSC